MTSVYGKGLYEVKQAEAVVSNPPSSVLFCVDSGDRFNSNIVEPNTGFNNRYNDFVIEKNQNLIQGSFSRIGVCEIRFPFCIPNVNERNNSMYVNKNGAGWVEITIPEGFYTGAQLAVAIDNAINVTGLDVTYNSAGQFVFSYIGASATYSLGIAVEPINTVPVPQAQIIRMRNTRSLMDLIGLYPYQTGGDFFNTDIKADPLTTGFADLRYTDYIDICSNQLTNYQKAKDMTTQNFVPRSALICRVYIENENSINSPTNVSGTFPFVIYRQMSTPKMIKWNNDSSIGQIDIRLYDMYGDPLYIPTIPIEDGETDEAPMPDFQITFLASEE